MGAFIPYDASQWETWHFVAWGASIIAAMHLLNVIIPAGFEGWSAPIEIRGKHLDVLDKTDLFCIWFNRLSSTLFVYHCVRACWYLDSVVWGMENATLANTLGSLLCFYVLYDLCYTLFHRALHHRSIYHLVHKHHHKQKAPSRGNTDAINVHPFEFVSGEYLHLLCIWLVPCHVASAVTFVVAGGIFASLNHTRYDVSFLNSAIYTVKNHDVHHRLPESNYGQYIMLWDYLFGSYRPYTEKTTDNQATPATDEAPTRMPTRASARKAVKIQ